MLLDPAYLPVDRCVVVDTQRDADLRKWKRACVMYDEVVDGKIVHKWRLNRTSASADCELYDFLVDRDTDDNIAADKELIVASLSECYETWWDKVSPGWETFPPFVLDDQKEPELTLFAHSWIGQAASPWNQGLVSKAGKGTGTHAIRFERSGLYEIELRRWPREDGGSIGGKSSSDEGVAVPVTNSRIVLGDVEITKAVDPDQPAIVFEMNVTHSQPTTLTTAFLDQDGNVLCGAYYVYIRKSGDTPKSKK